MERVVLLRISETILQLLRIITIIICTMNTLRTTAILLAGLLLLTSSFESGARRARRTSYGVYETDSLRWRDNCILADSTSHTYYFVGPAGRSIMSYKSTDLKHWEGPSIIYTTPIRPDGDGYVTDGPFLYMGRTGKLYMIWTTNNSCGIAISDSGKPEGPWRQQEKALYVNGGHGMIFRTFEGDLKLVLHAPYGEDTHPKILNLEDTGETLVVTGEYGTPNIAPKPLYRDPVYDGAADPEIIRNRETGEWYMFYTNRRANIGEADGVSWVHGSPIGIATSNDLTHWTYQQEANIGYKPDREPTYWAPSIVDDGTEYHMFLTYVPGVFSNWDHPRHIVHLVSDDLKDWKFQSKMNLMSEKVIDADVMRMPDGSWRMWYNQEPGGKLIAYADSPDLREWTDHGLVGGIGNCEGPKAFKWKGYYWLFCDEWQGFAVYRSDDATNWTRQEGNILREPGTGAEDGVSGSHCDVQVIGDRAYIFYFTHPDRAEGVEGNPWRSLIQVAELECSDGKTITCNRDAQTIIELGR